MTDGNAIKLEDQAVDLVFLNHVFHEIVDRQNVLREFMRILKGSGRLAIVERTRGGGFSGRLGPPVIDPLNIIHDLERAGFLSIQTSAQGQNSAIVGRKSKP